MAVSKRESLDRILDRWQALGRLFEQYAKKMGLTHMGLHILEILYDAAEPCTQKAICEKSFMQKQTVNQVIRSFWEKGYIDMKEDPRDRRNKLIDLTAAGREYAKKVVDPLWEAESDALEKISAFQCEKIASLAGSYVNTLAYSLFNKGRAS